MSVAIVVGQNVRLGFPIKTQMNFLANPIQQV